MKKIFIKDDRLRKLTDYRCKKIVDLCIKGKIKGSYTIEESSKEFKINKYPGYAIYFGWEVTDYEDGWKIDELDNFEITVKKEDGYYCATCKQFFTENVILSLAAYGKTFEGALEKFLKNLRAERKTLCVWGKAIEGKVEKAIYEK